MISAVQIPYSLISAVHELYTLYTRHGPVGPYRHTLFHDQPSPEQDWPAAVRQASPVLDTLIRGVACLLANELAPAAPPVCLRLLSGVIALERLLQGATWRQSAYYVYLRHDLQQAAAAEPVAVYRLFGEILAIYLDVLAQARPALRMEIGGQVSQLRQVINQFMGVAGGGESGAATGLLG